MRASYPSYLDQLYEQWPVRLCSYLAAAAAAAVAAVAVAAVAVAAAVAAALLYQVVDW